MKTIEPTLKVDRIKFGEHITLSRSPWSGHEDEFRIEWADADVLNRVIEGTMHQVQIGFESVTGVFIPMWCFDQIKD